jgi:protein involved in polysaccharide export with SLBB domain
MKVRFLFFLSVSSCFLFLASAEAQNLNNVNVQSLSTDQINQAKKALGSSGLTPQQAAAEARKRGASEAQIQEMVKRMEGTSQKKGNDTIYRGEPNNLYLIKDSLDKTEERKAAEKQKVGSGPLVDSGIFGSYLFNSKNLTFEPSLNIQTPKKYEVNIGDELIINIWGNSVQDYQLTVDKNGQISIPQVGPVYIAGKTFDEVSRLIKQRLISIYAGIGGAQPNTFAQINMGRLRSIKVNLVGEVVVPGTYTLPATATAFNALYLSGGPSKIGSFRNIKIYRDNVLIQSVDIYDFLLNGDQKDNVVLKNDDVIFVPVSEKTVVVKGEFKRNATFELKDNENLEKLVAFAGGFTDESYLPNLKVYRKTQDGLKIFDISGTNLASTDLTNGDLLVSQKVRNTLENRVTISGSVFRPGQYEWKEKMTVSELILKADSIMPEAMVEMGQITRLNTDYSLSQISFNIKDVLAGKNDVVLRPKDSILIKSNFQLKDKPTITVDGRVRLGGSFEYKENMSVLDAVYLAGGFTEDADSNYVQVSRRLTYKEAASLTDKLVDVFTIPLPRILNTNDKSSSFKLSPYDHLYIRKAPGYVDQGRVYIGGEVVYAGYYAIQNKKNRLSDLLTWSGGLTTDAYLEGATFSKVDAGKVGLDLRKIIINPGTLNDLLLTPGDSLTIPMKPETVNVIGQVQNPFAKVYVPGKPVKYYVKNSGGWGATPDKRHLYVTYPDGSSGMTKNFVFIFFPKVKPGSQIVVPKKPEHVIRMDLAQMWLAIGSTAATLTITVISIVNMLK